MDFADCGKKWQDLAKPLAKVIPKDEELLTEIESVCGALTKVNGQWGKLPDLDALRKVLAVTIPLAESLSKEVAGYQAVAKKRKGLGNLGDSTDKELDEFLKSAKEFKTALDKFGRAVV